MNIRRIEEKMRKIIFRWRCRTEYWLGKYLSVSSWDCFLEVKHKDSWWGGGGIAQWERSRLRKRKPSCPGFDSRLWTAEWIDCSLLRDKLNNYSQSDWLVTSRYYKKKSWGRGWVCRNSTVVALTLLTQVPEVWFSASFPRNFLVFLLMLGRFIDSTVQNSDGLVMLNKPV